MSATYGWIITNDKVEGSDEGTMGPHGMSDAMVACLEAGEGRTFKMFDDDGEHYYTGRIITEDEEGGSEDDFAPLDDFGMPNAGATEIRYRNAEGKFETL